MERKVVALFLSLLFPAKQLRKTAILLAVLNDRFYDIVNRKFRKEDKGMLQNVVEYLIQNPDVKEKVKEGTASLVGLTKTEQKAVLDVFGNLGNISIDPLQYW